MLVPKKLKHRKQFKGRRNRIGMASAGNRLSFGAYGLKSLEHGKLTAQQLESMRRVMVRHTQRGGKIWIRIFPHKTITSKGIEVKMGKGVGDIVKYVAVVWPGTMIVEIDGVTEKLAKALLKECAYKLPVKIKVVKKSQEI
jgi:large subunit ribosomal protein L16